MARKKKKSRRSGSGVKPSSRTAKKKSRSARTGKAKAAPRRTSRSAGSKKSGKKAGAKKTRKTSAKKAGAGGKKGAGRKKSGTKGASAGKKSGKASPARKKARGSRSKRTAKKAGASSGSRTRAAGGTRKTAPASTSDRSSGTAGTRGGEGRAGEQGSGRSTEQRQSGRKGITVVNQRRGRGGGHAKKPTAIPKVGQSILGPDSPPRKPLIPSGPSQTGADAGAPARGDGEKSKLRKRDIERFRRILLAKRAELVGDLSHIEDEALRGESGGLSHVSQHMADQGSDASDQSLSLDLAAVDRRLIKEIDDALSRIAAGTYGICEVTGRPIRKERLEELPWARYSIEAARELERRGR